MRAVLGAIASVVLQGLLTIMVFGADAIENFVRHVPAIVGSANAIEPFLYKSLSLRTVTRLLPSPVGEGVWVIACVLALFAMVRVCRTQVPVRLSLAVVVLASVLVNPHAYVYDGVVLALPFIWLAEWKLERNEGTSVLCHVLGFWAAAILMMPATLAIGSTAAVIATMAAILFLTALFAISVRDLTYQYSDTAGTASS
jgi:hypothetical protein